ncbi:hypothetical protein HDE_10872 [Halotydeus destructor]|nr:hypothetical protein HDE_10872 [Halotydeus destructor]
MLLLHREMHDEKNKNRFRYIDDIYMQLYSKRTITDNVLGRNGELKISQCDLEAWHGFVMQHEHRERFLQDFASVTKILYLRDRQYDTITGRLPLLTELFTGLKEVTLLVEREFSLQEAINLKNFSKTSTVRVYLQVDTFGSLTEDSRTIVDCYVKEYYHNLGPDENESLANLENLKALTLCFSKASDLKCLPNIPASLRDLNLYWVHFQHLDTISAFVKTNGRQLKQICLLGEGFTDRDRKNPQTNEKVRNLLEAIAINCHELTSLHIAYVASPSIYRDFLAQHIRHIGGQLTNLRIDYSSLNDSVVDTIVQSCKKLKHLHLACDPSDGLDTDKSYSKLSSLPKLEVVKLSMNSHTIF